VADPVGKSAITGRMNVAASSNGLLLYSAVVPINLLGWTPRQAVWHLGEPNDYVIFRISPDGRSIAAAIGNPTRADLWMLDVQRGVSSRFTFTAAHIRLRCGRRTAAPLFTGRRLAFSQDSNGAGEEQRVTQSVAIQSPTDWSRDARMILFNHLLPNGLRSLGTSGDSGRQSHRAAASLFAHPIQRTRRRILTRNESEMGAYTSNESGQREVYVQAFPQARGKFKCRWGEDVFPNGSLRH